MDRWWDLIAAALGVGVLAVPASPVVLPERDCSRVVPAQELVGGEAGCHEPGERRGVRVPPSADAPRCFRPLDGDYVVLASESHAGPPLAPRVEPPDDAVAPCLGEVVPATLGR